MLNMFVDICRQILHYCEIQFFMKTWTSSDTFKNFKINRTHKE